jgi:hypothetical protein
VLVTLVFLAALTRVPVEVRAQAVGVVCFATIGEVTGSLVWGVYHYRLHNLPLFVPPAHGLVYLAGLSLAGALRAHTRVLVATAAIVASTWGVLGLTVLPRRDVAGVIGVPLLLVFLWRGRSPAIQPVCLPQPASLELYGRPSEPGGRRPRCRPGHSGRQPAERSRGRLRVVRRDGASRRPFGAHARQGRQASRTRRETDRHLFRARSCVSATPS